MGNEYRSDHASDVIGKSLDLLYGDSNEKLEGINAVLSLCGDTRHVDVVQNHQLMSALSRLFGESENLPMEVGFAVGKLFLRFSLNEDFREVLSSHRVGTLALGVIELELKRALHRSSEPARVVFICLSILDNLADDLAVLRKMIKKSLVPLLVRCVQQISVDSVLVTLFLLRKASIFEESAVELSNDAGCISQLVGLLNDATSNKIRQEAAATLFNLSFHRECVSLISSEIDSLSLEPLLQERSVRAQTLQLLYHLSSIEEDRQTLFEAGITPDLVDLLQQLPSNREERAFFGLLVNMTLHPLCAEEIVRLGVIDHILCTYKKSMKSQRHRTNENTKQFLLRILRNLSGWTNCLQRRLSKAMATQDTAPLVGVTKEPESYINVELQTSHYWDKHFWDAHVEFMMNHPFHCGNDDLLVEWVGVICNLTADDLPGGVQWDDFLDGNSIFEQFQKLHGPHHDHDDLELGLIIWLGELCSTKECRYWIASNNLVVLLADSLLRPGRDDETKLQILQTYEQLLLYEETRFQVVGVVDHILDCLDGEDSLRLAAERCLILIEDFDRDSRGTPGEIGTLIIHRRYEEWWVGA